MKKRLHLKKIKQRLQDDMIVNVWDGSHQDKRRIMKMNHSQKTISSNILSMRFSIFAGAFISYLAL